MEEEGERLSLATSRYQNYAGIRPILTADINGYMKLAQWQAE